MGFDLAVDELGGPSSAGVSALVGVEHGRGGVALVEGERVGQGLGAEIRRRVERPQGLPPQ